MLAFWCVGWRGLCAFVLVLLTGLCVELGVDDLGARRETVRATGVYGPKPRPQDRRFCVPCSAGWAGSPFTRHPDVQTARLNALLSTCRLRTCEKLTSAEESYAKPMIHISLSRYARQADAKNRPLLI